MLQSEHPDWQRPEGSQEVAEELKELLNKYKMEDLFFEFKPNWDRSEVFPLHNENGESLLESYLQIFQNLCRRDNCDCELYHSKLKEKENCNDQDDLDEQNVTKENVTKELRDRIQQFYKQWHRACYKDGYSAQGTTNTDLGGGGNLPLDANSALKIAIGFFNAIPSEWWKDGVVAKYLLVLWIGKEPSLLLL